MFSKSEFNMSTNSSKLSDDAKIWVSSAYISGVVLQLCILSKYVLGGSRILFSLMVNPDFLQPHFCCDDSKIVQFFRDVLTHIYKTSGIHLTRIIVTKNTLCLSLTIILNLSIIMLISYEGKIAYLRKRGVWELCKEFLSFSFAVYYHLPGHRNEVRNDISQKSIFY